ncbi:hypothetical protein ACFC0S_00015 [Streptomyces sp. NPDC056084]|uniref:hypothetical protein n=1 Tax=unclassified Streptomyces TaxID=2593676 RepID=UPI0035E1E399
MIIDRDARVVPPRYTGKDHREWMGWAIGHADRDDMLQILVWSAECRAVREILDGWTAHVDRLSREMSDAAAREASGRWAWGADAAQRRAAGEAASAFRISLEPELKEAEEASRECAQLYESISGKIGKPIKLDVPNGSVGDCGLLGVFLRQAKDRLAALLEVDRQRLHMLALRGSSPQAKESRTPVTLDVIDAEEKGVFVREIRQLLEQEGNSLLSTSGHSPLMLIRTPSGRRVGINVLHKRFVSSTEALKGWAWFSGVLQKTLRDGAALDLDKLVAITNIKFNHVGRRFAKDRGMLLLDREDVLGWLEWGVDLGLDAQLSNREVG